MNAKANFQLSEQSVLFHNAKKLLDAYSIALETTTQIQTLIIRISKNIVFLKSRFENDVHPNTFAELESLISITRYLTDEFNNTFDVQCEKYQNSVTECDAGDLLEVYGLAHEVHTWFSSTIYEIKDELCTIKNSSTALCDSVFASLENLINIADYLSDNHRNTFKIECDKYQAEWETVKNG
jgi:hypothetical protein